MKLLSCHINGFGKLVNRDFDFSQITCFKHDNGWGKTTLANFIESMLFGMEAGRNKEVADNTRLKYEPWSGAPYGGTLAFSYAGKQYKIERFFGKTPAQDSVKIYDQNRMLCYEFGERGERLGEILFGLDRESYRKCVYLPHDERTSEAMTGNIRQRLIAMLGAGENSAAQNAVMRLDEAERALRAKRRPAKGKLDEIDDKLAYLGEQRAELYRIEQNIQDTQAEVVSVAAKKSALIEKIRTMDEALEAQSRRNERAAAQAAYTEVKASQDEARANLQYVRAFFGDTNPQEVNVEGLATAVKEYYTLQEETAVLEPKITQAQADWKEKQGVKAQLDAAEKILKSYHLLAEEKRKNKGAGKETPKKTVDEGKPSKWKKWQLWLAVLVSVGGIALSEVLETPGLIVFAVGALWLLGNLAFAMKPLFANRKRANESDDMDEETVMQLAEAGDEVAQLKEQLAKCPRNLRRTIEQLTEELEGKRARMQALQTAIEKFLQNFTFEEMYDYRTALLQLREKITAHEKYQKVLQECEEKSTRYAPSAESVEAYAPADVDRLKAERSAVQIEYAEVEQELARVTANAEDWERRADAVKDALSEEGALQEEKTRLENRLIAVRAAREFLLRARENMAKRYLDPVQKRVEEMQTALGFEGAYKIRFSGAGEPLLEEQGILRSAQFYSEGMNDLLSLCLRLAVSETLAQGEMPPLILDDPFVNLDDDSTERAKRLLRVLGKNRQIVYFTCKSERTL